MDNDSFVVDHDALVGYIRAALDLEGEAIPREAIERILDLEMEYLQHKGIADETIIDPRQE